MIKDLYSLNYSSVKFINNISKTILQITYKNDEIKADLIKK